MVKSDICELERRHVWGSVGFIPDFSYQSPLPSLCLHHINQGVIHACLFLLPHSRSVRPLGLPPLGFIRTVDGESRTDSGTDTKRCHMWCELQNICYIYRLSRSSTLCVWHVLLCEPSRATSGARWCFYSAPEFFTEEVRGQVMAQVQDQRSWVGLLVRI